ncbi:MAG: YihY/virulence factor BrkB family protein [Fibrobacterota bacterium]
MQPDDISIKRLLLRWTGRRLLHTGRAMINGLKFTVNRLINHHGLLYCSALSYSLLVAFVPLVASLSLFASKLYDINKTKINFFLNQKEVNGLLIKLLPYSSNDINTILLKLLKNAAAIGWIGSVALLFSVYCLFGSLEEIFNATWRVNQGRSIPKRIGLMVSVLILFCATFSVYVKVGRFAAHNHNLLLFLVFKAAAVFLLVLSFSMLYKLVPKTRVSLRASLVGGFFAAVIYEGCRIGLKFYVAQLFTYNKIYGSLILIPIFILCIYVLSFIIVWGNEMTYVTQNYEGYLNGKIRDD